MSRRAELLLASLILLIAAALRVYRLNDVPPGWRDDEVVETTVHAALVLEGGRPLYFPQAEGHEPLYHYLSAGWIALAGRSLFSVRLLSVFFGLFSLAALYRLARRLFDAPTALIATAALGVSFWSVMYSRFKLRHIGEVGFMLLAFYFFIPASRQASSHSHTPTSRSTLAKHPRGAVGHPHPHTPIPPYPRTALLSSICLSLSLYTYFAARAVPLILVAFEFYLLLFHRAIFRAHRLSFALVLAVTALMTAPLAVAIARTPGGEARLGVVGEPLRELLRGDATYVLSNTRETLGMFAFTGDPEYLYNIPGRPVFETLGGALFLGGMFLSLWRWREPRCAFLVLWLLIGLAPGFVSTPAASLGHTLAAQPAVYLFPAMALVSMREALKRLKFGDWTPFGRRIGDYSPRSVAEWDWRAGLALAVVCLFLGLTAARDLRDYFVRWPALPEVRYLYRADLHEAGPLLRALQPGSDLALTSRDLHPADVGALELETPSLGLRPRLFNPARVWMFPNRPVSVLRRQSAPGDGEFGQAPLDAPFAIGSTAYAGGYRPAVSLSASFANGLTCLGYTLARNPDPAVLRLYTYWQVEPGFTPPPSRPAEILSGSPIPLKIFSHLLNPDGSYLAGDDRLDVDPATLRPGDDFIQLLQINRPVHLPGGDYPVEIGVYDPLTGERVRLTTGEDHLTLAVLKLGPRPRPGTEPYLSASAGEGDGGLIRRPGKYYAPLMNLPSLPKLPKPPKTPQNRPKTPVSRW